MGHTERNEISAAPDRSLTWVGPFAVFILWIAIDKYVPLANPAKELLRSATVVAAIFFFSRSILPTRAPNWAMSIAIGIGVFVLWVAPDALIPGWRDSVLFQNAVTGRITTSIPPDELTPAMLALRTMRAALLVPIVEELFWRGWLPRWTQNSAFTKIPLGHYTPAAFWITAVLFAVEHGPFWEVGLVAGIIYNWWMRHTRSLGDLVLTHAVTNLALSIYVMRTGQWMFWM